LKLQTYIHLVVAGASAAVLFACGGGGGDSGAAGGGSAATQSSSGGTTLTSTAAASSTVQNIDYYGDSTVWGFASGSTGTQVANPAPAVFASQLPPAARYVVRNEGVSRTTACQLLQGTDGTHPDWTTQMRNSNAKFVIINHAINDQRPDIGESVTAYRACLSSLGSIARQANKIVIFETPNPTDQSGLGLEDYVAGMRATAAALGAPVIDQYQSLSAQLGTNDVRTLMPDGTHPSDATYAAKGRFAASEFLKMSF
jgi:lysophospholipase L1-like esterase